MSTDNPNPYQPTEASGTVPTAAQIDPATIVKMEAIIKDAGQFWLAILICMLCTCLGSLIIAPWYLARLRQWNTIAEQYPVLLDKGAPAGSLAQRFQAAKGKLITGITFGLLVIGVLLLIVLANFATGP